jgi:hypothetical protein
MLLIITVFEVQNISDLANSSPVKLAFPDFLAQHVLDLSYMVFPSPGISRCLGYFYWIMSGNKDWALNKLIALWEFEL